jgi:putative endonuclease
MAAKDDLGRAGEERAARHLSARGWEILDRNWRTGRGELDIVARSSSHIVAVEVKTRTSDGFGDPLDAVDARKRSRLRGLVLAWCRDHPGESRGRVIRIDVIGIVGADPATGALVHVEDVW